MKIVTWNCCMALLGKKGKWAEIQKLNADIYVIQECSKKDTEIIGEIPNHHHIDYCFLTTALLSRVKKVEIGNFKDWKLFSDHVPLYITTT